MAAILGSAEIVRSAQSSLDASSAEGLVVERWAGKPARLARMDRLCALALVACDGALVDAGLSPTGAEWSPERTGIVLGTAWGCHATNERYYRGFLAAGIEGASPRDFAYTLPSSPVGEITIHHKIWGPASTTVAGLSAVIDAIAEAVRHLAAGRVDRVLVAAADVATSTLARLGLPATHDSAAALVLEREGGRATIGPVCTRFVAGDPIAAARAAVDAVGTAEAIYAPEALRETLGGRFHPLDERALAAAPLLAIRHALTARDPSALIVVTDPSGQAGAVRITG